MSRLLRVFAPVAFACLLAALPACTGKSGGGKPKVAIVTNCTADFWIIAEAGAKQSAKENDVELIFRQPKTQTVIDQMEIVEALLKQGIKGLAVSVIAPDEQTPDLSRIAGQVNLVTMDNDAERSGRLCYVGVDNYLAGKEVGRAVKRALPKGGTVALFIGTTTSANSKDRVAGVLDELAGSDNRAAIRKGEFRDKYGDYTLYRKEPITDAAEEAKALSNAEAALEQLKNTADVAMVGLYAYNPKAILTAARGKKLVGKVKIVGFDEDFDTLDGIDKGEIEATVVQDPWNYGYESVKWLAHLAKNGKREDLPQKATEHRLVTKDGAKIDGVTVPVYKATEYSKKIRESLGK